ncbi:flavin monoamine oxidase family protein [Burkholderia cenocepacia]|uniref:flavin monoamine oxidase family protein n=1 Tax=Burkholderia cenocepacia TaxID=95486 RepID=UPI0009E130EF|nr:NAD(P)/FAD-dependent oxidoreductase [Burkholderia cenocepacia]ARF86971.1 lysine 2-monooxygenase [Burkholderia cenocepacia]MDC6084838.1 FAD-dependent oxidoreductase [Burkholderia cenocepacia]
MSSIPSHNRNTPRTRGLDLAALIPDFPFHYGRFLDNAKSANKPLFQVSSDAKSKRVLVVGAGVAGTVAAYELLRLGFRPVIVEASDRIGGRLNAQRLGSDPDHQVFAELGAMRFPSSGKAGLHYFEKVGMLKNWAPFPNPGSQAAFSTVIDYKGERTYYQSVPSGTENPFPIPEKYVELEESMFDPHGWLNNDDIKLDELQAAMSQDPPDYDAIKATWKNLLHTKGWDNLSFHGALVDVAQWDRETIDLFGQIGFGTGGWNTDYPNGFLEVLRVLYTGLDVDHRLMYDGTSTLPNTLLTQTPTELHDVTDPDTQNESVLKTTMQALATAFPGNPIPHGKEVRHLSRNPDNTLTVTITDVSTGAIQEMLFDAVIYTPHVRILDKLRHYGTHQQYQQTTNLFDARTWEAIQYTHYMQSVKIFMATKSAFWKETDPETNMRKMSVTLSDRLTRGTYLVDYSESAGSTRGTGIFLSYTWNDDALKLLGDRDGAVHSHAHLCRQVLKDIYPKVDLESELAPGGNAEVEINWENEPLYLGAFKMNLPGQYELQRRLFSQFIDGVEPDEPPRPHANPMILAGDDISWVAGWIEGAIGTAINAVNKVVRMFGGADAALDNPGPITMWDQLKPVQLPQSTSIHSRP